MFSLPYAYKNVGNFEFLEIVGQSIEAVPLIALKEECEFIGIGMNNISLLYSKV